MSKRPTDLRAFVRRNGVDVGEVITELRKRIHRADCYRSCYEARLTDKEVGEISKQAEKEHKRTWKEWQYEQI